MPTTSQALSPNSSGQPHLLSVAEWEQIPDDRFQNERWNGFLEQRALSQQQFNKMFNNHIWVQ